MNGRGAASALTLVLSFTVATCAPEAATTGSEEASAALAAIAEDVWQQQLEIDIQARIREGLPVEEVPLLTLERAQDNTAFSQSVLDRVAEIDRSGLSHDETLTLETLEWRAALGVEAADHYWITTNVLSPYSSTVGGLRALFAILPVGTDEERARFMTVLGQIPEVIAFVESHARQQMERGIVVPQPNMDAVVGIVRANIVPAERGPFHVPDARLAGLEEVEAFRAQVAQVVESSINPALTSLAGFLDGEYRAAAPADVGIHQYPGGPEAYRHLVRRHTTMDITAEEVHEIGLETVAALEARMLELQDRIGFEGTIDDFRRHIPANPDYFPKTVDEVKERIESASNEFFAQADRFFLTKPDAPFGARRLDPALEASQTYGYYNPPSPADPVGYYNFNGSDLDKRSWLTYKGLSFHELFPGHHFHITRQYANQDLPDFRRNGMHTAYTEGWGMYSTFLGIDSGFLEDDPVSEYGAYTMELFTATRLVVDTGMNALGWSLEEGRQFMRDHVFESEAQIQTESLRYSTDLWGQALGYQMGKRGILDLRRRAEAALGDDFDIRRFHEAVLSPGSLPMSVLDGHIEWFIEQERTN